MKYSWMETFHKMIGGKDLTASEVRHYFGVLLAPLALMQLIAWLASLDVTPLIIFLGFTLLLMWAACEYTVYRQRWPRKENDDSEV